MWFQRLCHFFCDIITHSPSGTDELGYPFIRRPSAPILVPLCTRLGILALLIAGGLFIAALLSPVSDSFHPGPDPYQDQMYDLASFRAELRALRASGDTSLATQQRIKLVRAAIRRLESDLAIDWTK